MPPAPSDPTRPPIGFIGTGLMGASMAGHLLAAGHPLHVLNRTRAKAEPLLARGAFWHDRPAAVAAAAGIVITMLGDPADVEEVYLGGTDRVPAGEGLVDHARPGGLLIDMTTSSPALAERIAAVAAARDLACLDAPVSGGDIGARNAALIIMAGGDEAAFARAEPLFGLLGRSATLLGPAGSGQRCKLANQVAVIQHECVHGICHLTFGSTGPTWLGEGLAELGNYWKDGDRAIDLPTPVIAYLQSVNPKRRLLEIAVPGRAVADTWQDYAWRWALCHLLANNPNYANRFVPLAIGLMEERPGVSFEGVYGPVAREVSFEYDQFLATLGNGYRSDLTAWPWQAKFQRLSDSGEAVVKIKAKAGWQASRVLVDSGEAFEVVADGTWRIAAAGQPLDADGEKDGRGRLVAAVFADESLSREIPLGRKTALESPAAGQLFLRCADAWTELADNDGEVTVTIRRAP